LTHFTNAQKAAIIERHQTENIPLAVLSDEYGVSPAVLYTWKRRMAESAVNRRLLESELVTRDQFRRALIYQRINGVSSVDALIQLGFLTPEVFVRFMAGQPGVPSLELRQYDINKTAATLVPRDFALERLALPIDRLGKLLTVAMACPLDDDTVRDISNMTGLKAKPVLAVKGDIEWAIDRFFPEDHAPAVPSEAEAPGHAAEAPHGSHPVAEQQIRRLINHQASAGSRIGAPAASVGELRRYFTGGTAADRQDGTAHDGQAARPGQWGSTERNGLFTPGSH